MTFIAGARSNKIHTFAHRGCWSKNAQGEFIIPENSVAAVREARRQGYEGIECDVHLTKDGKIWDPSTVNTYEDVFKDRDPRMVQSILPPNTPWEGGKSGDLMSTDDKIYTYPLLTNNKTAAMTYSGYYMRKYVEPSTVKYVGHDDNDLIMIRYAEVLLNYAEAKERLGQLTQDDLDKSINLLRNRVGMVKMNLSSLPAGSDIRTEIQRERRIELFFEGHRYFDIIRWKQGELFARPWIGIYIPSVDTPLDLNGDLVPETLVTAKATISNYKILYVDGASEPGHKLSEGTKGNILPATALERKWHDYKYVKPVPAIAITENPNLSQNPGW